MYIRHVPAFLFSSLLAVAFLQGSYGANAPCDLLTQTQLKSVVGVDFGAGSPIADTGCSWQSTGSKSVMVTVSMQSERMFAGAKRGATPISGIGDEAFFTGVQNFASLWVRKAKTIFLVRIYGLSVGEAQPKIKTLAADVLLKL